MLLRRADLVGLLVLAGSTAWATPHPHGAHRTTHRTRTPHSHSTPAHRARAPHSRHSSTRHHAHGPLRAIAPIVASPRPAVGTRSIGCGTAAISTGLSEQTLVIRGVPRTFLLFVPSDYDASTALALVFGFH